MSDLITDALIEDNNDIKSDLLYQRRLINKKYYESHKDIINQQAKNYYANKKKLLNPNATIRPKKNNYSTTQSDEKLHYKKEYAKQYYLSHKESMCISSEKRYNLLKEKAGLIKN